VSPITPAEEQRFQALMQSHHYLGALPKIGNTIWYVATAHEQWLALLSFWQLHLGVQHAMIGLVGTIVISLIGSIWWPITHVS